MGPYSRDNMSATDVCFFWLWMYPSTCRNTTFWVMYRLHAGRHWTFILVCIPAPAHFHPWVSRKVSWTEFCAFIFLWFRKQKVNIWFYYVLKWNKDFRTYLIKCCKGIFVKMLYILSIYMEEIGYSGTFSGLLWIYETSGKAYLLVIRKYSD